MEIFNFLQLQTEICDAFAIVFWNLRFLMRLQTEICDCNSRSFSELALLFRDCVSKIHKFFRHRLVKFSILFHKRVPNFVIFPWSLADIRDFIAQSSHEIRDYFLVLFVEIFYTTSLQNRDIFSQSSEICDFISRLLNDFPTTDYENF